MTALPTSVTALVAVGTAGIVVGWLLKEVSGIFRGPAPVMTRRAYLMKVKEMRKQREGEQEGESEPLATNADDPDTFVVFLIGATVINWRKALMNPRKMMKFGSVAGQIFSPKNTRPAGLLGSHGYDRCAVQYWRSLEDLTKFATGNGPHVEGWAVAKDLCSAGIICVWHETFVVRAGEYENVYVNAPLMNMGKCAPEFVETRELKNFPDMRMGAGRMEASKQV